jgi:radical SAM superfamily enzyme YgiQ (UPF0313 family)
MKVLFIQNFLQAYYGVMSISAVLKSQGHETEVLIVNKEKDIPKTIKEFAPDVVGFSCTTAMYPIALEQSKKIKEQFPILIIFGGVHPTICPEIIEEKSIDIICRGEGEYALLELLNSMEKGQDISKIKNLWVKKNNEIYKNDIRNLIEDLDELPFPDRDIYYSKYPYLKNQSTKVFFLGRGCPYKCSFCINETYINLYKGKGRYIRRRSIDKIMEEILDVKKRYGLEAIYFNDDTFTLNKDWIFRFLEEYKKKAYIPFTCGSRASLLAEEMVQKLKDANCYCVEMGVETGNEKIRKELLGKTETNESLLNASRLIKKAKIRLKTSNMMCLPGETVQLALETIRFNSKLHADFMNCSLLQPYPLLEITNYATENGFLDTNFDYNALGRLSYFETPIKLKDKNRIMNLQKFFYLGVWFPWTIPAIEQLSKFPPNPIYTAIFKSMYVYSYAKYHQLSILDVLKLAVHSRKLM